MLKKRKTRLTINFGYVKLFLNLLSRVMKQNGGMILKILHFLSFLSSGSNLSEAERSLRGKDHTDCCKIHATSLHRSDCIKSKKLNVYNYNKLLSTTKISTYHLYISNNIIWIEGDFISIGCLKKNKILHLTSNG